MTIYPVGGVLSKALLLSIHCVWLLWARSKKDELTRYRELEKAKRAIEYTIYEHQLVAARTKIAEVTFRTFVVSPTLFLFFVLFFFLH